MYKNTQNWNLSTTTLKKRESQTQFTVTSYKQVILVVLKIQWWNLV